MSDSAKVYFIENVETGRIKVGFTTSTVASRLAKLQTGSDCELRLLGFVEVVKGVGLAEAQLHRKFAAHHHRGEWYSREILPEVLAILRQARQQCL